MSAASVVDSIVASLLSRKVDSLESGWQSGPDLGIMFITKKSIISDSRLFYDPCGALSPLTFLARILLQYSWGADLSWDKLLPDDMLEQWNKIISLLNGALSIPISSLSKFHQGSVNKLRTLQASLNLSLNISGMQDGRFGAENTGNVTHVPARGGKGKRKNKRRSSVLKIKIIPTPQNDQMVPNAEATSGGSPTHAQRPSGLSAERLGGGVFPNHAQHPSVPNAEFISGRGFLAPAKRPSSPNVESLGGEDLFTPALHSISPNTEFHGGGSPAPVLHPSSQNFAKSDGWYIFHDHYRSGEICNLGECG